MITSLSVDARRPSTPVYLLPRFSDDQAVASRLWEVPIEAPSQEWFLHVGNAFEEKDEKSNLEINIYAAACSYHWFNFHKMFGKILILISTSHCHSSNKALNIYWVFII